MNREQIIEAMARALVEHNHDLYGVKLEDYEPYEWAELLDLVASSLTALETAIPGLADVIAGKAYFAPRGIADGTMHVLLEKEFPGFAGLFAETHVIVPVEPTKEMSDAGYIRLCDHHHLTPDDVYRAMIEARPK